MGEPLEYEVVAEGLRFPEGPVAMADGSVLLVEIAGSALSRVHPDGTTEVVADCGGGPNGAAVGPDGDVWLCNNGGFFSWNQVSDDLLLPGETPDDLGGRQHPAGRPGHRSGRPRWSSSALASTSAPPTTWSSTVTAASGSPTTG